jgi:hypothetical protein
MIPHRAILQTKPLDSGVIYLEYERAKALKWLGEKWVLHKRKPNLVQLKPRRDDVSSSK